MSTDLALLTGPAAGDLIAAALRGSGARLLDWSATQVDHQPGRGTTVGYAARLRLADGSTSDEVLGASSRALPVPLPSGVVRVGSVGLWRFPHDPDLPGLAVAADPERMRRVCSDVGWSSEPVAVRVVAYRPRRRAVVRVDTARGPLYVKAVRPERARGLHRRHRLALAAGCPVPPPLGWSADGLVVLAGLPGRTLRRHIVAPGPDDPLADPAPLVASIVSTLGALPPELATGPRRRTWGQKARHYAEVIAAADAGLGGRARRVAAAVHHSRPQAPDAAVHGDFYESQLLVAGGVVTGLLDIDTAGRGERMDDAACLLAHLSVLAQIHPHRSADLDRLGMALLDRFTAAMAGPALAARTAAVVLSLATGPHRVQEPRWRATTAARLDLAERWLDLAAG
ncbi:aminoglycoside phosphotransferase family protein [Actinokineospora sp. NPDC004072]